MADPAAGRLIAWLAGIATALLLCTFGYLYSEAQRDFQVDSDRQAVREVAVARAVTLQRQLSRSLSASYALAAVLRQYGEIGDFERFASSLIDAYGGVSSLQLAPNGVVSRIHPLAGNERAIGHDLLNDPRRRADALRTIAHGTLTLAGPVELIQGGQAVIGRLPVFLPAEDGESRFWGFSIVLIRLAQLIEAAELGRLEASGLAYRLTSLAKDGGPGRPIAESRLEPPGDTVKVEFEVPNGHWRLDVAPVTGWVRPPRPWETLLIALLGAVAAGWLVQLLVRRPFDLATEVVERRAEMVHANRALDEELQQRIESGRQLRDSEARFQQFIDHAGDTILFHDEDGVLSDANREACLSLGYTRAELLSRRLTELASGFSSPTQCTRRAALEPGATATFDDRLRHADGSLVPVELHVMLLETDPAKLYALFARDISERLMREHQLEENRNLLVERVNARAGELRMANASLAAKIAERREAEELLRAAKQAADEAAVAKGRFLANLSHEIRTPMNGLIGMLELLAEAPLDELQRGRVETARTAGEGLLELLDDLLDFTRLEAGYVEIEQIQTTLRPWLEELVERHRATAAAKGLALRLEVASGLPDEFTIDPARLRQVLDHLLGNALKFTDTGSIELRAEGDEHSLRLAVQDAGIGIPEGDVERIFDAFAQGDELHTRRFAGTGLGLTICRRLVALMGGRLEVDSRVGHGSTFRFAVPPGSDGRPAAAAPHAAGVTQLNARVLVAEDDPTSQRVAQAMLGRLGCESVVVGNGEAAVAAVREGAFDLVLLDCRMPVLDGYRAAEGIRALADGGSVPILGLTGDVNARQACVAAGMNGCLTKPLRLETLRETLGRWVGKDASGEDR